MKNQSTDEKVVNINEESHAEVFGLDEIYDSTTSFVQFLREKGAGAPEISYVLAFVATQFGLWFTDNSYRVFPVVLRGIDDASRQRMAEENARGEANTIQEDGSNQQATIH